MTVGERWIMKYDYGRRAEGLAIGSANFRLGFEPIIAAGQPNNLAFVHGESEDT